MANLTPLQRIGIGLIGYNSPSTAMATLQSFNEQEEKERLRLEEEKKKAALSRIAQEVTGQGAVPTVPGVMGPLQPQDPISTEVALSRIAGVTGDPSGLINYKIEQPGRELDRKVALARIAQAEAQTREASRTKLGTFTGKDGDVYSFDPYTGATKMVYDAPAKPVAPESTLGKLAYDRDQGLITQDEYNAGVAKETGRADASKNQVPGFDIAPGATPTEKDATVMKSVSQAKLQLNKLMIEYANMVDKYGFEVEGSQDAQKLRQKEGQIQLQMKNLEELGALQAPDIEVLEKMMGSPVGTDHIGPEWLRQPWNAWNTKARSKWQVADFMNYLDDRMNNAMFTRGYVPKEGSPFSGDPLDLFKEDEEDAR